MKPTKALGGTGVAAAAGVVVYDLLQRRHTLLHNFPMIGHARYALEKVGPELRQYIVTGNDEERPFSRDQRTWVYASSKLENNYVGFGTDNDVEHTEGYVIVKHRTFADVTAPTGMHHGDDVVLPSPKVLGGPRRRAGAFRPQSCVNVSAMSFGALSGKAIQSLNRGVALAGAMHNTGEGGLSDHHRQGGDLVFQIGTAYFGCRDEHGRFDLGRLKDLVAGAPVRAIEIKLSQGAKPGLGGMLPAAKISPEIARIRGIPMDRDCASPSRHSEFHSVDELLDFVERIADETGLPVGVKSAVGHLDVFEELARLMSRRDRGVDFLTIDGGEGGTGASPLVFSDSVALPFRVGFSRVRRIFDDAGLGDDVTFIGSAKLGIPENAVVAFALGADMVNVGREAMMAIGCIQSQKCHTDRCPTGVATQNPWLSAGLDPQLKSVRLSNYLRSWRRDMLKISEACGVRHPALLTVDDVELLDGTRSGTPLRDVYGYSSGDGRLGPALTEELESLMSGEPEGGSAESAAP